MLWGVVFGGLPAASPLGSWWLDPATVYALSLTLIAAVYIGFAVADGRRTVIAVEAVIAGVFGWGRRFRHGTSTPIPGWTTKIDPGHRWDVWDRLPHARILAPCGARVIIPGREDAAAAIRREGDAVQPPARCIDVVSTAFIAKRVSAGDRTERSRSGRGSSVISS